MPGPLLSAHAGFEDDCGKCHTVAQGPSLSLALDIGRSGLFGDATPIANSLQCMACHDFGTAGLMAHSVAGLGSLSLPQESGRPRPGIRFADLELRFTASLAQEHFGLSAARESTGLPVDELACAMCHRDHAGRDNLEATAMSDLQCQVCHQQQFAGFPEHPPFASYPYRPASGIAFNHSTHFNRHFPESTRQGTTAPENCASCHSADSSGSMGVRGFEACASCHLGDIIDPPGREPYLEVLAPPGLDLESLEDAGVGDWPYFAEAEPNAFLRLMLDAGEYLAPEDQEIVFDMDLFDLVDASEEERMAVARLAWAFKALTWDIVRDGPDVFVSMAQDLHGAESGPDWSSLAASLPYDVMAEAARQWFPALEEEIGLHESEDVPTNMVEGDFDEIDGLENLDDWLRFGGWGYRQLGLAYRPTGHSDRFLRGWLEFSSAPEDAAAALFDALTTDDAAGACAKCHVVRNAAPQGAGAGSDGDAELHWFAFGSGGEILLAPADRRVDAAPEAVEPVAAAAIGALPGGGVAWTRPARRDSAGPWYLRSFSHWSHRQAISTDGCASCHGAAAGPDVAQSVSGFTPVGAETCAACHAVETGLSDCLTCHIYHFDDDDWRILHPASTITAAGESRTE